MAILSEAETVLHQLWEWVGGGPCQRLTTLLSLWPSEDMKKAKDDMDVRQPSTRVIRLRRPFPKSKAGSSEGLIERDT
jgi:hypothetical protein